MTKAMTDLAFTPAAELTRLIARQVLSPVELVDMVLACIERAHPTFNRFITGWADDGLPVGQQLVGPHLSDPRLLRAAASFEASRPWVGRRPLLSW